MEVGKLKAEVEGAKAEARREGARAEALAREVEEVQASGGRERRGSHCQRIVRNLTVSLGFSIMATFY